MKNKKLLRLVVTAMFASLIAGLTIFPKIPIPAGGYVHLGDAMIYLSASFLPLPYAIAAAVIGGGMADIISGFVAYAPFTIIAKALLTLSFNGNDNKILTRRNRFAPVAGLIITPVVYLLADGIIANAFAPAIPNMIWNFAQALSSLIVYYIIGSAFDKLGMKHKLATKFQ